MSHVNQEDGIRYADGDEEYRVSGYVVVSIPVSLTTTAEPDTEAFEADVLDAIDWEFAELDIDIDLGNLNIEIVRREE